jgi:hypothetical protein
LATLLTQASDAHHSLCLAASGKNLRWAPNQSFPILPLTHSLVFACQTMWGSPWLFPLQPVASWEHGLWSWEKWSLERQSSSSFSRDLDGQKLCQFC